MAVLFMSFISDLLKGRTNNLAHPSIRKTCLEFFYKGNKSLAAQFPADFRDAIPDNVIALVITVVCLNFTIDYYTYYLSAQALSRGIFNRPLCDV